MSERRAQDLRARYARTVTEVAHVDDPRIEEAFAAIPREDFLPPPPWTVLSGGITTRTNTLGDIYANVLIVLDRRKGINNGEPSLHAAWLDAISPQPGEQVIHVGAGMGYYTAILAYLTAPGGQVDAYEYQFDLAEAAIRNLKGRSSIRLHAGSAWGRKLVMADIIYVNAGVKMPDPEWLYALKPGGRLIFPWQPKSRDGTTMLVIRRHSGFEAIPLMKISFIPCTGTERIPSSSNPPDPAIAQIHSLWLADERDPDVTAVAVWRTAWFSTDALDSGTTPKRPSSLLLSRNTSKPS